MDLRLGSPSSFPPWTFVFLTSDSTLASLQGGTSAIILTHSHIIPDALLESFVNTYELSSPQVIQPKAERPISALARVLGNDGF